MSTDWESWDDFADAVLGRGWDRGESPDFSSLLELEGEARANAVRLLWSGVENEWIVAALGLARLEGPKVVPQLELALPRFEGGERIALAEALRGLTGDDAYARPILEVLESDPARATRAAVALRSFRGPDVEAALFRAV